MNLRNKAELFFNEIEAELQKVTILDSREKSLTIQEASLTLKQKELDKQKEELQTQVDNLKKEQEYVKLALEKTAHQEIVEKKLDEKREAQRAKELELITIQEKIDRDKEVLEGKIKDYENLQVKEKELEVRQSTLTKAEELLDKRKELMDMDQKFLDSEKLRLQAIASRYS